MPEIIVTERSGKGKTFAFENETIFIGRSVKSDIQINDIAISRKHLKIFRIGKKFFVEDLKSTNGTIVNKEMITPGEGYEVGEKDIIRLGATSIQLGDLPLKKLLEEKELEKSVSRLPFRGEGDPEKDRRAVSSKNLELIYKVSELIKKSYDPRIFGEKILEYLMDTFPRIDRAAIFLFGHRKKGDKDIKELVSQSRKELGMGSFFYSRKVVERVMKEGKAIRMSDTDYEKRDDFIDDKKIMNIRSIICVPIISSSEVLGTIYMDSIRRPYGFRKEDMMLLHSMSGYVSAALVKNGDSPQSSQPPGS